MSRPALTFTSRCRQLTKSCTKHPQYMDLRRSSPPRSASLATLAARAQSQCWARLFVRIPVGSHDSTRKPLAPLTVLNNNRPPVRWHGRRSCNALGAICELVESFGAMYTAPSSNRLKTAALHKNSAGPCQICDKLKSSVLPNPRCCLGSHRCLPEELRDRQVTWLA